MKQVWLCAAAAGLVTSNPGAANFTKTRPSAAVDLRIRTAKRDNAPYVPIARHTVARDHRVGDNFFPYEGIGWENELVGYRLYLDERGVTDTFGKIGGPPVLASVDYRRSYHDLAPWGMDIMHVGPSLGIGGLGRFNKGKLARFGPEARLSATVLRQRGRSVSFRIDHESVVRAGRDAGQVSTEYSLAAGSPLTHVQVRSNFASDELATGIVANDAAAPIEGRDPSGTACWLASWGPQSMISDDLGLVVFYRCNQAIRTPTEAETHPLRFTVGNPDYAFASVWTRGPMGIHDRAAFMRFVEQTASKMARRRN